MDRKSRTLAGRYRLGAPIGRGGMGTVYRGADLVLRRPVAIKLISDALAAQDPASAARLEREAKATAALAHPAVVTVYDAGIDGRTPFIVMELLTGRDLAALLRERLPLPPGEAVRIAEQVAAALAAAHSAGMIHRDIKPANVMLTDDGAVKVLDFGLARARDASTLTQAGRAAGTASYMAPELAMGGEADERSDIYSLGCLIYAMLTGSPPFTGQADAAILHQHVHARPRPLRATDARVPQALAGLVDDLLAKDPDARPQHATQVAVRLRRLSLTGQRRLTLSTPTPPPPTRPMSTLRRRVSDAPHSVRSRSPAARAPIIALTLLGAVFAAALIILSSAGAPGASQAPAGRRGSRGTRTLASAANETRPGPQGAVRQRTGTQRSNASPGSAPPGPRAHGSGPPGESRPAQQDRGRPVTGLPGGGPVGEGPEDQIKPNGAPAPGKKANEDNEPSERSPPQQLPPGHDQMPLSRGGTPPGHGGTPPGHGGTPPGQAGDGHSAGQDTGG